MIKPGRDTVDLPFSEKEFTAFAENVPAGMICFKNDNCYTLLNMNEPFLLLCGFTENEIFELYKNKFLYMIYENDREGVVCKRQTELTQNTVFELEYRLYSKTGQLIWIMERTKLIKEKSGDCVYYSIFLDITQHKKEQSELRLSLERYNIIMNHSDDIIFEWDIECDKLYISSIWKKKFGYKPCLENITNNIPDSQNIYKEDLPIFLKIMDNIKDGIPFSETELRIRQIDNEFVWCRIRVISQFNDENKPIKAVGVITNIDKEKKHKQSLAEQAERDALTGLYHKAAIQKQVREYISICGTNEKAAMLIIDLDNFKAINDNYGHLCGDAILSDSGLVIKSLFRSTDLIGRIGGDEFLVYMKNIRSRNDVAEKAKEVQRAFSKINIKESVDSGINCSIGISIYPDDAVEYLKLYKCSDNALYYVKNHGRANYAFFDKKQKDIEGFFMDASKTAISDEIESQIDDVDEVLTQYIFKMLYDSLDINSSVNQLLEIVGKAYGVSRVYIFENSNDELCCSNTFEWCNEGILPQINRLQNVPYDSLGDYFSNFDEDGVFYCRDIKNLKQELYDVLAPQEIESMLQCAIIDEGCFKGYVGFDECRNNRYWTKHQIRSLSVIANVLSAFLLKHRLKEKLVKLEENLKI